MRTWLTQSIWIICLTVLAALGVYFIVGEPDRSYPCVQAELEGNHVCLSTVLDDWNGDVLWVDARDKTAFSQAHIEGAILIPENDAENQLTVSEHMEAIGTSGVNGQKLVVYCATDACGASELVAKKIESTEFHSEVFVLQGGWKAIAAEAERVKIQN